MMKSNSILTGFLLYFLSVLVFTSCYERSEGCLDVLATNFDISADDACDECCTYPTLDLFFKHRIGEDAFTNDSTLLDKNGIGINITKSIINFSDFSLSLNDGNDLVVRDMARFEDADGNVEERIDDFIVVLQNSNLKTVGEIRENGEINSLSFQLGVGTDLIALDEETELFDYDTLYDNGSYYDIVLYGRRNTVNEDDISIKIKGMNDMNLINFELQNVIKTERVDLGLLLTIDYEQLISNLELNDQDSVFIFEDWLSPDNFIKLE